MLHIFICEDNVEQRVKITRCIENFILMENLDMRVTLSTADPFEVIEYIKNNALTGLYFLDVDLNQSINGIQLAEQIRVYDPRGFIVFITTHAEALHLTFTYKVEALDFIIKDDIEGVGKRICECIANVHKKYTSKADGNKFSFKLPDNKIAILDYDDILFFETSQSSSHKVIVYSNTSRHEFYAKLDGIKNELNADFFRCHKSFIVNMKNIDKVDVNNKVIIMKGGSECLVSVRQITKLQKLITAAF